jgi:hypothetical protein
MGVRYFFQELGCPLFPPSGNMGVRYFAPSFIIFIIIFISHRLASSPEWRMAGRVSDEDDVCDLRTPIVYAPSGNMGVRYFS